MLNQYLFIKYSINVGDHLKRVKNTYGKINKKCHQYPGGKREAMD